MQIKDSSAKPQRIFELDFLRGILMILMSINRFFYFVTNYVGLGIWDPNRNSTAIQNLGIMAHDTIRGTPVESRIVLVAYSLFFLLSGISLTFSRKNYKRALMLLIFFLILYTVYALTSKFSKYFIMLEFGIFIGYCLFTLFFQLIRKLPLWFHIALTVAILVLTIYSQLSDFNVELSPFHWFGISKKLNISYYDSWDMFPSLFFFATGGLVGRTVYKNRKGLFQKLDKYLIFAPFTQFGKNSIKIYIGIVILYPVVFILLTPIINAGL
ncbi:MAG: DUF1624 domain-containing protein [Christensenellaceae bacterium]|jgi:uncharacterized membrane protein|nr:DUF1624 domain-containing protein [Christensenellaceae bacterium]